jgi:hypothetical protein
MKMILVFILKKTAFIVFLTLHLFQDVLPFIYMYWDEIVLLKRLDFKMYEFQLCLETLVNLDCPFLIAPSVFSNVYPMVTMYHSKI